jgi:hypothetical protein
MKQVNLVCAILAMIFVVCTQSVTPVHSGSLLEELAGVLDRGRDVEKTIAAQVTVNHYFYSVVTPKLRACWGRVQGEGTIEMALNYRKSGVRWLFESVERIRSSVPEEQGAVALQCMQESARDTSFLLEEKDSARTFEKFVLKWTWLVPLPAEGSDEMVRRMAERPNTTPKGCAVCKPNYPARCQWSSAGGEGGCRVDGPNACSTDGTKCLTGMYGSAGGSVIVF